MGSVASLQQLGVGGAVSPPMGSRGEAPENFAFFTFCGSQKVHLGKLLHQGISIKNFSIEIPCYTNDFLTVTLTAFFYLSWDSIFAVGALSKNYWNLNFVVDVGFSRINQATVLFCSIVWIHI